MPARAEVLASSHDFSEFAGAAPPAAAQGAVQGSMSSAGSLVSILGLSIGGLLYPIVGGGLFLVSSGLFLLVLLTARRLFRSA